ncbi:sensor histidine kinase [Mucilaginibacter lacusdianchii]|uniref:sensor histidine kinase n=1 Tax=Mucilaginibacter lacusdianchii TaxID=2684211 RepID=UPI001E4A0E31|nr:sensor histidine kinase [Mucilaginibacter sp. JXJ CY 39]
MNALPFVFSNQTKWRIVRHCVFWLSWFLFQAVLYSFSPSPVLQQQSFLARLSMTSPESLAYLMPHQFLAYTLMYWVIPRFVLKGQYGIATFVSAILFLVTAILSAIITLTLIEYMRKASGVPSINAESPLYIQLCISVMAGLRGGITIGGLAAAIKLMKCFYEKEQAALILEREKVSAELQMLKAQIHPHFLFNTLNNIFSYTQEVSVTASNMIFGLSELLRYMLYECNQPFVSLDKELKMLADYIALEKARYDKHLDLSVNMPKPPTNLKIAPLLLLPLIENCFKHGASKMISDPWISMDMTLNGAVLSLRLINGKAPGIKEAHAGIGTANTQKRLDLIYAGKYEFKVLNEVDMYVVNLKLSLDYVPPADLATSKPNPYHESRKDIQLSDR